MISEGPWASVIIPTRNRGRLVEIAIESALAADNVGEVIVVDDGSTDDTQERLGRFKSRIQVLSGAFGSAAAARNAGAAEARFELLAFLDSDDEMLPLKVPCLAPQFEDLRVGLVHGRMHVMDEVGTVDPLLTGKLENSFSRGENLGTNYGVLARYCAMLTSATLIRRAAFEEVGGYDSSLPPPYEDMDLYLRMSLRWVLLYERCVVARYRIWSGNFGWETHAIGMLALATKHLGVASSTVPKGQRRLARFGLNRRLAVSSQTLVRTSDTRRYLLAALRARPAAGLTDVVMLRILLASFLPHSLLRRRRPGYEAETVVKPRS